MKMKMEKDTRGRQQVPITHKEKKKAAAKTVTVLGDGGPKSVLKNGKNGWTDVASGGGDREIEMQTPINEITERKRDGDVDQCVTLCATAPRGTLPTSSSSSSECVKRRDIENEAPQGPLPLQVTKQKDTGVTVTQDKPPHADRTRDSEVHDEEGDHDDADDGGDNDNDDGGDHNDNDEEEDDDGDSLVLLSEDCVTCVTDGELHYITTHEIQLSELSDQEEEEGEGLETGAEEDSQVYSFVDYTSFVDDVGGGGGARGRPNNHMESDLLRSEESPSKTPNCGGDAPLGGQVHLSIKAITSRALNDLSSNIEEKQNNHHHHHLHHHHHVFGDGAKQCFIAAPGRLHFGRALKGRDATRLSSSGASSANLSEPDDADQEVRHLTRRAFKSLAYPRLSAITFSSSGGGSSSAAASDVNRWSAFVDLRYGELGVDQLAPTSSFGNTERVNNRHKGYVGVGVIAAPAVSNMFTVNNDNSSGSSARKIELLRGKFGHARGGGGGGVFTLTETLNFRCNVGSGMPGGGGGGSRGSADGVTDTLRGGGRRGARTGGGHGRTTTPCNNAGSAATMEDAHKKAVFASSLLKNVISKKMQFEEERKMERGEICERRRSSASSDGGGRRRTSMFSEGESADMGDDIDPPRRGGGGGGDALSSAPETYMESAADDGAGTDPTKLGALEAAKSTLLRSQNSAFRSWRDGELEFPWEHKDDKTREGASFHDDHHQDVSGPCADPGDDDDDDGKLKKMSRLFLPTIQVLADDGEAEIKRLQTASCATRASAADGVDLLSIARYDADSRRLKTAKSPEIKINLRVKDSKKETFGVANLRPRHLGGGAPGFTRSEDFRCQALAAVLKGESADKLPHFMVRDIRENKGKLQTPIYQVRDVRKLVKSSYHFVSLDNNNETKSSQTTGGDSVAEQKKPGPYRNQASVSPIVIKCQSVNTNSNGKQSGNLIDSFKSGLNDEPQCETDRFDRLSPEGAKGGFPVCQRPLETLNKGDAFEGCQVSNVDPKEKASDNSVEKKPEASGSNQTAFRKLQAAVKTMEQLYVFDRNEWKRKGGLDYGRALDSTFTRGEERGDFPRTFQQPKSYEDRLGFKPITAQGAHAKNAHGFSAFGHRKPAENHSKNPLPQTPSVATGSVSQSPMLPASVRISQVEAEEKRHAFEAKGLHGAARAENYLIFPLKPQADVGKRVNSVQPSASRDKAVYAIGAAAAPRPTSPRKQSGPGAAEPAPRETTPPAAAPALYNPFPLGMVPAQPQVFCFSPTMSPAPATLDHHFQATQRKMLLDPTTGNYYLVDTPVPPASRRLYDPETGQYVDVPVPQPPMTPMSMSMPMSMPVSMSPMALSSPGAYGQTYMFYPGFMPGPVPNVIPARTLSQPPPQQVMCVPQPAEGAADGGERGSYAESPYYLAMGGLPPSHQQQQVRAPPGPSGGKLQQQQQKPVISITSQQGPRIVAPPSFDGTTMSFVVEHR
ncbi:hypothetical protein N1851_028090 [Merluccius polli]|uniref:DUF4585 domain-containing protein n=1 Tax=Merluccius polli TaxID=89951 RepID=A0AA47M991_MERPO|nr:hypothetical protein N1851_028090 [Merluccius polli]